MLFFERLPLSWIRAFLTLKRALSLCLKIAAGLPAAQDQHRTLLYHSDGP